MKLSVKRVYDGYEKSDGPRILVDRLWPRGVSKSKAHIDMWAKELAPSNMLRSWLHKDPEARYREFVRKYKSELSKKGTMARKLLDTKKRYMLVTAVKDLEHSHIPTLTSFLKHM